MSFFGVIQCIVVTLILTVNGYTYIGCYWSDVGTDLSKLNVFSSSTTVGCIDTCISKLNTFAATNFGLLGFRCYCGNENTFSTRSSDADCNAPCPRTDSDQCGMNGRTAVYSIGGGIVETSEISTNIPSTLSDTEGDTLPVEIGTNAETTEILTSIPSTLSDTDGDTLSVEIGANGGTTNIPSTLLHAVTSSHTTERISSLSSYIVEDGSTTTKADSFSSETILKSAENFTFNTTGVTSENVPTTFKPVSNNAQPFSTTITQFRSTTDSDKITNNPVLTTIKRNSTTTMAVAVSHDFPATCLCPCSKVSTKWDYLIPLNLSREELRVFLDDYLTELENNITIDKKNTSAYKNTLISAPDSRKSSGIIGSTGAIFICVPILVIVSADLINFLKKGR